MKTKLTTSVVLAATAIACGASAAPAAAVSVPTFGIGDQKPTMFNDPLFRDLGVRRTRIFVPWNVALVPGERARFETWLTEARGAGTEPLVAFNHSREAQCPRKNCRVPSVKQYKRAFLAFKRKFGRKVRVVSPWNEANHQTQPTGKNPKRAAEFYNIVQRYCRGCRIVALDLLDSGNQRRYLRTFMRYAKKKPRYIGLHNYSDVNRRRTSGLKRLISEIKRDKRLRRTQIWLTETGGIVRFETDSGKVPFRFSPARAASRTNYLFKVAREYRRNVRRVYLYQWNIDTSGNRFDAGLIDENGRKRPAYDVVKRYRKYFR
ncbi:MAG: hypothetical protein H0V29_05870 [Thermoleophilaceae bacterium]|nr:hypothetical protein [Thermoleophilaceae bacterium]